MARRKSWARVAAEVDGPPVLNCIACVGTGHDQSNDGQLCRKCGGTGDEESEPLPPWCPSCAGSGLSLGRTKTCADCGGSGFDAEESR